MANREGCQRPKWYRVVGPIEKYTWHIRSVTVWEGDKANIEVLSSLGILGIEVLDSASMCITYIIKYCTAWTNIRSKEGMFHVQLCVHGCRPPPWVL